MTNIEFLPEPLRADAACYGSIEEFLIEQRERVQRIKDGICDWDLEEEEENLRTIEDVLKKHQSYGNVDALCDQLFHGDSTMQ